mgnify:CR=1 FL=1
MSPEEFELYRATMNAKLMDQNNLVLKRLFSLDAQTYSEGALSVKTKELLGLVSSMVLRCDDCIKYHLEKCFNEGVTDEEMNEVFMIANHVSMVVQGCRPGHGGESLGGHEFFDALDEPTFTLVEQWSGHVTTRR